MRNDKSYVTEQKPASRPTPQNKTQKVALALQGGGSHGAFTWGVLDKLLEDGRFEIEGISGTSAGGMNALALIQGLMKNGKQGARDELHRFWWTMSQHSINSPFQPSLLDRMFGNYNLNNSISYHFTSWLQSFMSPYQFNPLNVNPLQELVGDFFDFDSLRQYKGVQLFLCATHIKTGKLKIFTIKDLSQETLLASACLPFMFQAVPVNGEFYWDGGFVGNPAVYPLIYECETRELIVVQLTSMYRDKLPTTATEIIDRHKEITYNACLMREMRSINYISQLIDRGILDEQKVKRLHVHLIRNEDVFLNLELSSALNTNWQFLQKMFHLGRETAEKWIQDNYQHIGVKSTMEIEKDFV